MANRFWVGGAATWDGTAGTKWATTSGGAGGAAVPTAADDVFFDAASGANTVTLSSSSVARSINCTGFTGTISHPASTTINVGDATAGASNVALLLSSGMTYTVGNASSSIINFISTSATQQTITSNGKTMPSYTINGAGSSYILGGANTVASSSRVTVTAGIFNTGNFACSWGQFFFSGSTTRTVTLGSSVITLTGSQWEASTVTNLTFNANTSVINCNINATVNGGGLTYNKLCFKGQNQASLNGNNTFAELEFVNTVGNPQCALGGNQTVTTLLTITGNNVNTGRQYIRSNDNSVQRTITCNGSISLTNVDFTSIIGAGTASWTGTSIGNAGNNSGITFTTPVTRYWVYTNDQWQNTANWSATSGGATGASVPLPQDQAIFNANSFSSTGQQVNVQSGGGGPEDPRICAMDWTGVTNNPTFMSGLNCRYTGSIVFSPNMTMSGSFGRTFIPSPAGVTNITMNGQTWPGGNTTIDTGPYACNFLDNFAQTLGNIVSITGTLNISGNVTAEGGFMSGNATRTINMGNGTWTLVGTSPWSGSSLANLTINSQGSTIKLTNSSTSNKNFGFSTPDVYLYNKVWVATGNTGIVIFTQTSNYANFQVDAGRFIRFNAGTTATITNATGWNVTGTAGNLITIDTNTGGSSAAIVCASGIISSDYISLKDSAASGGASFYAGANSTNVSGNTGWTFTAAPVVWTVNVNDNITVSENVVKAMGVNVAENVTITETVAKAYSMAVSENVTITETVAKTMGVNVAENITITEDYAKDIGKNINENIAITELVTTNVVGGYEFGPNNVEVDNFARSNVAEITSLDADAVATDNTITVKNVTGINTDYFVLIGTPGNDNCEMIAVDSITDNVVTLVTPLVRNHGRYSQVMVLRADKIKVYRAESVGGAEPAIGDYAIQNTISMDYDELTTTFVDGTGTDDSRYRVTYYNSLTNKESDIDDSVVIPGDNVGLSRGDYVSVEAIREEAGFTRNTYISDNLIDQKRQEAQARVDATLSGIYVLPLSKPINPLIQQVTRLLAAGYLLLEEYGPMSTAVTENGQKKIDQAEAILEKLNTGDLKLVDAEGVDNSTPGAVGGYSGWPDASTATADIENGGAERLFRVGDRY